MSDLISGIEDKLRARHNGDQKQLEVVFSSSSRLLIEAPAGYGKTKTMVSRIAYMIATGQIPYPKRLLALTFSVNAAYKIKKDVSREIPELLQDTPSKLNVAEKIFVSNYHGFCRNVLRKHGNIFFDGLASIDLFETNDDSDSKLLMEWMDKLTYKEATFMSDFNKAVKLVDTTFVKNNLARYCEIVIDKMLPVQKITFNGILTLVIKLFSDFPTIKEFYNKYFGAILVDEYQDTNILSYWLITLLVSNENNAIFFGDSLQRIYGFIGAVPNLLTRSEKRFGLTKISLDKNHRFASNPEMLKLDKFSLHKNQDDEAEATLSTARLLIENNPDAKIAILTKQRARNIERIMDAFKGELPYFYGLFTDQDPEYVKFHRSCLTKVFEIIETDRVLNKKTISTHLSGMRKIYGSKSNETIEALFDLLEIFWNKLFEENAFLSKEDKITFIKDTFDHNGLKQYIEFVNSSVTFSTVHAAKGLEWDFVIIPDMEQDSFPNWPGLCGECISRSKCDLKVTKVNEKKFLEELSIFYVAVTRAKKQVLFSASKTNLDRKNNFRTKNVSCFLSLPGIREA